MLDFLLFFVQKSALSMCSIVVSYTYLAVVFNFCFQCSSWNLLLFLHTAYHYAHHRENSVPENNVEINVLAVGFHFGINASAMNVLQVISVIRIVLFRCGYPQKQKKSRRKKSKSHKTKIKRMRENTRIQSDDYDYMFKTTTVEKFPV